ncbi:MAG TPA: hypothetical protein VNN20_15170 [Thermodesulfobacteriota bacterium]|nr:hypothetical protein [Thermodesulfobacteriota bacterium]
MKDDKKTNPKKTKIGKKIIIKKDKKDYFSSFKRAWEQAKKTVSGVSESVKEAVPKNFEEAKEKINTSVDFVVDKGKEVLDDKAELIKVYPRNVKLKFKDDIELIKSECSLLNEWKENKLPPVVIQSAIYAAVAMGLKINELELARLSRDVMDSDSSSLQRIISTFFDAQQLTKINTWIDKVPGKETVGGMYHRIEHGHDIEALVHLFEKHELEGVMAWFNHIALRDFWTPAGVPYLPSGSGSVYEWLCELGISSEAAADLLTINSWEMMAAILAYNSSKKMYGFIRDTIGDKRAKRSWERGLELEELGDYEAADHCFQDVLSYISERHHVEIWYATNFLSRAQKQEKENLWYENLTRCYDLASRARLKLSSESTIPYQGGILINLRGLATTLMVSS